jgi:hypothetical protein
LLEIIESISSFTVSFQKRTSLKDIASHNVFGSSSTFRIIDVLLNTAFLSPPIKNTIKLIEI